MSWRAPSMCVPNMEGRGQIWRLKMLFAHLVKKYSNERLPFREPIFRYCRFPNKKNRSAAFGEATTWRLKIFFANLGGVFSRLRTLALANTLTNRSLSLSSPFLTCAIFVVWNSLETRRIFGKYFFLRVKGDAPSMWPVEGCRGYVGVPSLIFASEWDVAIFHSIQHLYPMKPLVIFPISLHKSHVYALVWLPVTRPFSSMNFALKHDSFSLGILQPATWNYQRQITIGYTIKYSIVSYNSPWNIIFTH